MRKIRALINSKIGVGLVFFLFGVLIGLNKETAIIVLGFCFFPVESEYIFTYDKNFDCSKAGNIKTKIVCAAISEINERITSGEINTKNFGVFEKSFLEFIKGERPIKFYFAKNIQEFPSEKFSSGINSHYDRLKFYLWGKSVKKSSAFTIIFTNKIYLGQSLFKVTKSNSHIMTHEILHLCWATEEEVNLLGF